jgi:hypothetical protein
MASGEGERYGGTTGHPRAVELPKHLGCLALGAPLGIQLAIPCKEVSALEEGPALGAILIATLLGLDYRCHNSLPTKVPPMRAMEGEGWRGTPWLPSLSGSSQALFRSSSRRDGRNYDRGPMCSRVVDNQRLLRSAWSLAQKLPQGLSQESHTWQTV